MGVSAGFVGTADVSVVGNVIRGGDYSVGADGSFPLLMSTPLFVHHWAAILAAYPGFSAKYPSGPAANGKLVLQGNDFVLAGQVLLDMASHFHAAASTPAVFDAGFNHNLTVTGNVLSGAVCGVSMYRTRSSTVAANKIDAAAASSPSLAMYGVELGMSHNVTVDGNAVSGRWAVGLLAEGTGVSDPRGCGPCQAHLGATFNIFSGNTVDGSREGVVLGLNTDCAGGNSVTGNNLTATAAACNFGRARPNSTLAHGNRPACDGSF